MGEISSLKLARKRKARAEREAKAAENRAAFCQPKHEREINEARRLDAARKLDGHRRDKDNDGE